MPAKSAKQARFMRMCDLAYLAGIIDGEGSISLSKLEVRRGQKVYVQGKIHLNIYNCDLRLLKWIQTKFGGRIHMKAPRKLGWKPSGQLHFAAKDTVSLLRLALPYLIIKKEQATLAIAFQSTRMHPSTGRKNGLPLSILKKRHAIGLKLKHLNQRGVQHACKN